MSRWLVAATVIWVAAMLSLAQPRRVGDASEYVAMASQLADGRGAALSPADMDALTRRWAGTDAGYELQTREFPALQGRDGRFDMLHPWVYPLLGVPGVWLARAAGLADAWGLVALNVAMVGGLLWLAARRGAGAWALTLFVGPLVWWLDKPAADLLITCAAGAAVLTWPSPVAILLLGIAAAQNPALAVVAVVFTMGALAAEPARLRSRAWVVCIVLGVVCAAMPPAYYLWRLGRFSPQTIAMHTAYWPPLSSLLYPLFDLNAGFVVRFAPGAVAAGLALAGSRGWSAPAARPAIVAVVAMLVVFSQQPNHNQGGGPDFTRYWLWVWPLLLPWLLAQDASPRRMARVTGLLLFVAGAVWSTVAFRPTREESYRYPTPLAAWVWRTYPGWSSPAPEAFAERTSHREPGWVPTATSGCEKVLLHAGEWPASCPPLVDAPEPCRSAGLYCYANADSDGTYTFTAAGRQAVPDFVVHDRTWVRADAVSAWVAQHAAGATSGEGDAVVAQVRGVWGIEWRQAWTRPDGQLVVYARHASADARIAFRHAAPVRITVTTPTAQIDERRATPGEAPTMVAVPPGSHVLIVVRNDDGRP